MPSPVALDHYAQENAHPIPVDRERLLRLGCRVVLANMMDEDQQTGLVRHNPQRLASILLRWYGRTQDLRGDKLHPATRSKSGQIQ